MANGNGSSVDFEVWPKGEGLVMYNESARNPVESSLLLCDRKDADPFENSYFIIVFLRTK